MAVYGNLQQQQNKQQKTSSLNAGTTEEGATNISHHDEMNYSSELDPSEAETTRPPMHR